MRTLLIAYGVPGFKHAQPDIGLGFIATRLRESDFEVTIRDFSLHRYREREFDRYLRDQAFDLVGMKVFSGNVQFVKEVLGKVRTALPNATIICGGPHPSCAPEHSLTYFSEADYICVGEGESCIENLARQLRAGKVEPETIPGLGYRVDGGYRVNPSPIEEDMTRFGMPAWDLMPPKEYAKRQSLNTLPKGRVIAPISISRGCPFLCSFCTCHTIMGRRIRYRPVELVLDEIEMLVRHYGVDEVQMVDDHFTRDRAYVLAFCEGLQRRKLNIHWACPHGIRVDSIDAELFSLMEKTGCYMVSVGIESATERILDLMQKRITPEEAEEKVQVLRDATNMTVQGFFIIGYPTETRQEMIDTIEFARRLPLHIASFTTLRLTPGAGILDQVRAEGWKDIVWEGMDSLHIHYHPKSVTAKELANLRAWAYWRFYATPARVMFMICQITSWRNLKSLVVVSLQRLLPSPRVP